MTPREQNAIIARWMGWAIGEHHTPKTPSGKPWVYAGKVHQNPPDYTNDLNAIGEVLERIRQSGHTIHINGEATRWTISIKSLLGDSFSLSAFGPTEQAAKVAAIISFIKAMEGGEHE